MHLVNEQDDAAGRAGDFIEHRFQPFLELAAELGARNQRAHVQRHQFLVAQAFGHIAIDDAQRQAFGDGGLAHARLADQHRIVLGAAAQHLDGAADFLVAADHRIQLAGAGQLCEIAGIFLERVIGIFRRGAVGGAALAQIGDRLSQTLRGDAGLFEDLRGPAAGRQRQRQQQIFGGDETVARLLGDLFGIVEQLGGILRQIDLAGAALNLRQFLQRRFDTAAHGAVIAAGRGDQARGQAFLIVNQDFEKMIGGELLVALTQGQALRRLNEAARTLGEFLDIHSASGLPRNGRRHI